MGVDLYVYYRVRTEHAAALQTLVRVMQDALHASHNVRGSLKRRPEEKDGHQTWMEVYPCIPEEFEVTLEQAVTQAGLGALTDGRRNIEHFMDIASCA